MGQIRPLAGATGVSEGRRPRLTPILLGVVALVIIGWLSLFGSGVTEDREFAFEVSTTLNDDPRAIVGRFVDLLLEGDGVGAAAVMAPGWTTLELPGLPFRFLQGSSDLDMVEATLSFYGGLVDLDLATCRVDPPLAAQPHTRVVCIDASISGAYAEATRSAGFATSLIFEVGPEGIAAVLRAAVTAPVMIDYCSWVEQTAGDVAASMFDTRCWPEVTGTSAVLRHARHAAAYVALGRPRAEEQHGGLRSSAGVVDRFRSLHNLGEEVPRFFAPGQIPALPGLVGDINVASVDQADILAWSATMYRIDLGDCSVSTIEDVATVDVMCPDATWAGPLVEASALPPVAHPVEFNVSSGSIAEVRGETHESLLAAFGELCAWIYDAHPIDALAVFGEGCTPEYSRTAATRMLELAFLYP